MTHLWGVEAIPRCLCCKLIGFSIETPQQGPAALFHQSCPCFLLDFCPTSLVFMLAGMSWDPRWKRGGSLLSHRLLACESPGIQCAGQWQQPAMRGKYPQDAISGWIRKVRNDPNKTPCCFEKNFVLNILLYIILVNHCSLSILVDLCGFCLAWRIEIV